MYLEPALACLFPSTKALAYNTQVIQSERSFHLFSSHYLFSATFRVLLWIGLPFSWLSYCFKKSCLLACYHIPSDPDAFSSSLKQLPEPSSPNLCFYSFNTFLMTLFTCLPNLPLLPSLQIYQFSFLFLIMLHAFIHLVFTSTISLSCGQRRVNSAGLSYYKACKVQRKSVFKTSLCQLLRDSL